MWNSVQFIIIYIQFYQKNIKETFWTKKKMINSIQCVRLLSGNENEKLTWKKMIVVRLDFLIILTYVNRNPTSRKLFKFFFKLKWYSNRDIDFCFHFLSIFELVYFEKRCDINQLNGLLVQCPSTLINLLTMKIGNIFVDRSKTKEFNK